jgi:hypothetical protein
LDRKRHTVCLPPLTWSMDGRTLLPSEERTDTIPILHKTCHSAAPILSLRWLATSVELLSTIDLMCRATNPSARVVCQLPHDT